MVGCHAAYPAALCCTLQLPFRQPAQVHNPLREQVKRLIGRINDPVEQCV